MAPQSPLFDQIKAVWESSPALTTNTKPESLYMVNRFLSLDPDGLLAAIDCNRAHGLPEWAALQFLKYSTVKKPSPYNKYPKKLVKSKKLTPKQQKALEKVCGHFAISEFHGTQVMSLLEQQGVKLEFN